MSYVNILDTSNKYDILYADPPWKFGGHGGTKWIPASFYYNVMSFEELKLLPVQNITRENCILFLWTVNPETKKCIEVGESWGFRLITLGFVWYKERANVGNYTMPQCELCWILKKGKIPSDRRRNPGVKSFYSEAVTRHSQKPDEFRKRIDMLFPRSRKIELFARQRWSDWDYWGEEIND